jgi:hypothetical protein
VGRHEVRWGPWEGDEPRVWGGVHVSFLGVDIIFFFLGGGFVEVHSVFVHVFFLCEGGCIFSF